MILIGFESFLTFYREVGLSFEGREHSGIEDARNTAKLVVRMFQSGCPLSITATKDENSSTLANTAHRCFIRY